MGAWGIGPFENDDAMDFLADLRGRDANHMLGTAQGAIEELEEFEYLDDADAARPLAAAVLIAAARDGLMDSIPQNAHDYARALAPLLTPDLLRAARSAIERIRDAPEMADFREEPGWQQHLDDLASRLSPERT